MLSYYASASLLLISVYSSIFYIGRALQRQHHLRARLRYARRPHRWLNQVHAAINNLPIIKHIALMLESIESRIKVSAFIRITGIMLLLGIVLGSLVFTSIKGVAVLATMFGLLPYVALRMILTNKQMKARLDFLPAVEIFYQQYVVSHQKNIRVVLGQLTLESKLDVPIKPLFEQLDRNLSTHRGIEDSLHIFTLSLGHLWAEYFVNMLRVGLTEGVDLSDNLQELISDMRKAQRADQAERNRLLEIRLANFTPLVFLAVYMGINFKINYNQAYYYYFVDSDGKNMLLNALIYIFLSFLMGVYLSIKRM